MFPQVFLCQIIGWGRRVSAAELTYQIAARFGSNLSLNREMFPRDFRHIDSLNFFAFALSMKSQLELHIATR